MLMVTRGRGDPELVTEPAPTTPIPSDNRASGPARRPVACHGPSSSKTLGVALLAVGWVSLLVYAKTAFNG